MTNERQTATSPRHQRLRAAEPAEGEEEQVIHAASVAWAAHPSLATIARDALDLPLGNSDFMFLVAAVIGATFNPWMIFYQQSAIADKKLRPRAWVRFWAWAK